MEVPYSRKYPGKYAPTIGSPASAIGGFRLQLILRIKLHVIFVNDSWAHSKAG
ncbi:hypothetical protein NBG4_60007 [Candidatus Sulfobium mesophilum]|uniref:Uncharacterized protein n=1 Tax=Candidatus Sulfobium mesophilum TaxID=2016548 RepID=A0A2U3QJE3_9BACT|nr:hypothetical protein NBG4_60007 [Candidatus Sulfobium mesophilum]